MGMKPANNIIPRSLFGTIFIRASIYDAHPNALSPIIHPIASEYRVIYPYTPQFTITNMMDIAMDKLRIMAYFICLFRFRRSI